MSETILPFTPELYFTSMFISVGGITLDHQHPATDYPQRSNLMKGAYFKKGLKLVWSSQMKITLYEGGGFLKTTSKRKENLP